MRKILREDVPGETADADGDEVRGEASLPEHGVADGGDAKVCLYADDGSFG